MQGKVSRSEDAFSRRLPMKMTASTRIIDGVTIVDPRGRLVLGEESAGLRDLVRNLVSRGNKKILLNLRDVNYIDSSGLGELVNAFTNMRRAYAQSDQRATCVVPAWP
jgi:anti-anti-sigma factor